MFPGDQCKCKTDHRFTILALILALSTTLPPHACGQADQAQLFKMMVPAATMMLMAMLTRTTSAQSPVPAPPAPPPKGLACDACDTRNAKCSCNGNEYDFSQIQPSDGNSFFSGLDSTIDYMYYFKMTGGGLPSDDGSMPYCTFAVGTNQGNAGGLGSITSDDCFPIGLVAQQSWEIDTSQSPQLPQVIRITFSGGVEGRQTVVSVTCDPSADDPTFTVKGETRHLVYEVDITSKFACVPTPPSPPKPPASAVACPLDPNGCKWLAPPCEQRSARIPTYEFVKLAPNKTRFAGLNSLEGIKFTAGEMYGGSIVNPAPVLCAFPNTFDGKFNSWILAARDLSNPPPTYFKMVEVILEKLPPKDGVIAVGMSTTRAGYLQQANNQCKDASDLMDAWSNRIDISVTGCGIRGFPECNGYGLIGVEISAVTSTAPLPWNTYDVSSAAQPPGKEFAVPGNDPGQTYFYNFCRGTAPHGDNSTSFGFACRGGVSAVCEVTQNTVSKGLAYPCGTVQNVVAKVTKTGLHLSYSNPRDYNNGRNTEVTLECDQFADEPVFFPVAEDPNGGPKYSMQVRTKAGCSTNAP